MATKKMGDIRGAGGEVGRTGHPERRASGYRPGLGTPGRSRRVADRRMSTSVLETARRSSQDAGAAQRCSERRNSRSSVDRALLAVHRGSHSENLLQDKSPSPSRHSCHSQASLVGSPKIVRSHRRSSSHEHSMRKNSRESSPSGSPKRHSHSAGHSPSISGHNHHHHHQSRQSRSGSIKTPVSASSTISLGGDGPTSKTHLLKQHALAQRGLSVEDVERSAGGGHGEGENVAKAATEMAVAGLVMIAGTSCLVVSFATGGTTWTIVGSTFTGLGALFLVVGICWYLSKTKDEDEQVEIRVVDSKQLAELIKQGVMVKQVQSV